MTTGAKAKARAAAPPKRLAVDAEARELMASPVFRAMLDEAKVSVALGAIVPLEELERRRPLTDEDKAIADEYLAVFDRLAAEQDAEVTEEQARALNLVLIGARSLREGGPLAEWAEYTGIPEAEIHAAAVALAAVGLKAARPTARAR